VQRIDRHVAIIKGTQRSENNITQLRVMSIYHCSWTA